MSFISKVELKYQLEKMGIKVEGNYVKKIDLLKVLANKKYTIIKDDDEPEVVDEKRLKEYAQNMYDANRDDETPPPHKKVLTIEQAIRNIEWAGEEVEME